MNTLTITFSKMACGLLLLLTLLGLGSCKKDHHEPATNKQVPEPVIQAVMQFTVFDEAGKPDYLLYITGINFNKNFKNYKVLFNEITAQAITGDSLHFRVRVPAEMLETEAKLTIVMDGKSTVFAKPFKTEQIEPAIDKLNTEVGMRRSQLIINGSNFSPVVSENSLTLNGVKVTVDSVRSGNYQGSSAGSGVYDGIFGSVNRTIYSGLTLYATIPADASTGKLVLTSYGKTVSYPYTINVLPASFTTSPSVAMKSISFDAAGNCYGVLKNKVFKVTAGGVASTLATIGDEHVYLGDAVADAAGNVYVASGDDYTDLPGDHGMPLYRPTENSNKIFKISAGGEVSVLAGSTWGLTDGQGTAAQFRSPTHLVRNPTNGDLFVSDALVIRKLSADGLVSTLAGSNDPVGTGYSSGLKDGQGTAAGFLEIYGLAVDAANGDLYVIDNTQSGNLRKVSATGYVSTLNTVPANPPENRFPTLYISQNSVEMAVDAAHNVFVATNSDILKISAGVRSNTYYNPLGEGIFGLAFDAQGQLRFNTGKWLYKITP